MTVVALDQEQVIGQRGEHVLDAYRVILVATNIMSLMPSGISSTSMNREFATCASI
jgi:hypothetical protein